MANGIGKHGARVVRVLLALGLDSKMMSKRRIVKWKLYLERSRGYIGLLQLLLTGAIFLNTLPGGIGDYCRNNQHITFPASIVSGFILCFLVGYLDRAAGLWQEEMGAQTKNNPALMEILKRLEGK